MWMCVSQKDTQEILAAVKHGHSWEEASQLNGKHANGYGQCNHQTETETN